MEISRAVFLLLGRGNASVLPNIPVAWILNMGRSAGGFLWRGLFISVSPTGGFPMKVSFSQDGSSSDSASRSQDDFRMILRALTIEH